MIVLLTNDDGIDAEGLKFLYHYLKDTTICRPVVVAPEGESSAISNAISIRKPLRVRRLREDWYSLNGTPTDCIQLAVNHVLDERPAFVFAGINHGPNIGEDIIYSGTVGAAIEGGMNGIDSVAISLVMAGNYLFDTAGKVAADLLLRLNRRRGGEEIRSSSSM